MVRNLWLGGEWDTEDEMWWGKLSLDAELHKPYAWIRLREDGVFNGALGCAPRNIYLLKSNTTSATKTGGA